MAYGLYLKLDQKEWYRNDFSATNALTGTLYTDIQQVTPKTLTGYTIKIRMSKGRSWGDRFNKTGSIVSATAGTFSYNIAVGEIPPPGLYKVAVQLTKSGDQETTLNRQELYIIEGPSS